MSLHRNAALWVVVFHVFALVALSTVPALADGALSIVVTDAATKMAIEDAEVFLIGPVQTSALTDKRGMLRFSDAPSGVYRVDVRRRDFKPAHVDDFEIVDGRSVTLRIELASTLREVANVVVRSRSSVSDQSLDDDSAGRKISTDLNDALNRIAGVSVNNTDPQTGSVGISLRGHDESQTGISLDGIQISSAVSGMVLSGFGTDLFSGASVDFSGSASSLGGQINYRTIEPTKTWITTAKASYSTYDRSSVAFATTGTIGKLGIAAQFAKRNTGSPFDDLVYPDQSGLLYAHDAGDRFNGQLLRLKYSVAKNWGVSAEGVLTNRGNAQNCPIWGEILACGQGPGGWQSQQNKFAALGVQGLIGNVAVSANAYGFFGGFVWNRWSSIINGVPNPTIDLYQYQSRGISLQANVTVRRHSLQLGYSASGSQNAYQALGDQAFSTNSTASTHVAQIDFADSYKINSQLTALGKISYASATGTNNSALGTLDTTWKPTRFDTFDVSVQAGSAQASDAGATSFGDPNYVGYVCGGLSRIGAPGDPGSPQSSLTYNASWSHTWRRGQLQLSAYRQTQSGQGSYLTIPIGAEPAGFLPPGYISAIQTAWSAPTACGAQPFDPSAIYLQQYITGTVRRYEGYSLGGRVEVARNILLFPSLAVTAATMLSDDPRFQSPYSVLYPGAQLPYRPLATGSLIADIVQPKAKMEYIASAHYVAGNNGQRLGAYVQVDGGIVRVLSRGTITAFVSNVFNEDAGIFWTTLNSYGLPLRGGGSILQAANPLTPRSFTVQYSVRAGRKGS